MDITNKIIEKVDDIVKHNYPIDYRVCVKQVVDELVDGQTMNEITTLFNVSREEYIEDMCKVYDRFVRERISKAWGKVN